MGYQAFWEDLSMLPPCFGCFSIHRCVSPPKKRIPTTHERNWSYSEPYPLRSNPKKIDLCIWVNGGSLFHRPPKFPTKTVRNKLVGMKRLLLYYWFIHPGRLTWNLRVQAPLEEENHGPNHHFQVLYVNLQGNTAVKTLGISEVLDIDPQMCRSFVRG